MEGKRGTLHDRWVQPTEAACLASEVKRRSQPASGRTDEHREKTQSPKGKKKRKKSAIRRRPRNGTRVRTVVATMANSETFGWQMVPKRSCNCVQPN